MCRSCLNTETVVCSHCGARVWTDDNYGNDGMPLCEHCYDEYYTTCSRCERVIHRDDAYSEDDDDEPYCSDCYKRCLFGLLDYTGHFTGKQKNKIVSILSTACEECGTDVIGISYNHNEHLSVFKCPLAAHKMRFAIPNVPLIMGHTRMTTQGDEKMNYNDHPFYGKVPFCLQNKA